MKTVKVDNELHKKLSILKIKLGYSSISDVIEFLIKEKSSE